MRKGARRRLTRTILGAVAALAIFIVFIAVGFVLTRGETPPITDSAGRVVAGSVASLEWIELGGVEQAVLIRGRDRTNPVLLFLHGGPGMPAMYLAHAFQRDLEEDFVVVQWDRRGAGKSYRRRGSAADLSVRRELEDTYELTRLLRRRFGQERIYLVGHSWGSYLGMLAISEHPEYYAAYIGTGQLATSPAEVGEVRREELAARALLAGDSALAREFRSGERAITEDVLFRYGGELRGASSFLPLLWTGMFAPEYTLFDVLNVPRGVSWVSKHMRYDLGTEPLDRLVMRVDVPVFLFLGRHDLNTPSVLAAEYLDRLDPPLKRVVWFEESAHFPFFEEPARFHSAMLEAEEAVAEYGKARQMAPTGLP